MLTSLLVLTALGVAFAVQVLRDHRTLTARVERLAAQLENVENLQSPTLRSAVVRVAQPLRKRYQIDLTLNDGILKLLSDEEMKFWNDQAITLPSVTIERWRGHTRVRARFHEKGVVVTKDWFRVGGAHGAEIRLWEAELGTGEGGYSLLAPRVLVMLDGEWLRFGAKGGRFEESFADGGLLKQHTFDSVPLEFARLREEKGTAKDEEGVASDWSVECDHRGAAIDWFVRAFDLERFFSE